MPHLDSHKTQPLPLVYLRLLFRHLGLSQHNCTAFFRSSRLDYPQLMTLDAEVSFSEQRILFKNALDISGDPALGITIGQQLLLTTHGPLGGLIGSAHRLIDALNLLCEFGNLREPFFNFQVVHQKNAAELQLVPTQPLQELNQFLSEAVICALVSAIRLFAPEKGLVKACFDYSAPMYQVAYRDYLGCSIEFDAPCTSLVLDSAALSASSPLADPISHAYLLEQCKKLRDQQRSPSNFSDSVRFLLNNNPGKIWSLEEVARQLHTSNRTLIRKLKDENARFQSLRDDVLETQAKNLLDNPQLSVESAAHLIGFSDVASFRRSFKRWTGQTPQAYRGK